MGRRYVVTVDRHMLERTERDDCTAEPILVEDTETGNYERFYEATLAGARIVYGPPRRDGARVWIEADAVDGERR